MLRLLSTLCALALLAGATAAGAQPTTSSSAAGRIEISASAGLARTWGVDETLGTGSAYGGSVLVALSDRVSIGAAVHRIEHEEIVGISHDEGTSTMAMATAKFTFGPQRVQPFMTASFGVLSYSGSLTVKRLHPPGSPPPVPDVDRFTRYGKLTVAGATGGLDLWITCHLAARPMVSIHITQPTALGRSSGGLPTVMIGGGVGMAVKW